jgi:hypothetical protein
MMVSNVRCVIPGELRELDQWVCWSREGGTKVPKIAGSSRRASSTDPKTWHPFEECVRAAKLYPGRYAGVGFVFTRSDPYVGVDLDDVRDPKTGIFTARAQQIVSLLDSYAEVSPSGTGVKLWVRARLDHAKKKPGVEVYPHSRYFAVTGSAPSRSRPTVEERQAELEALIREEFPKARREPPRPCAGPGLADEKTDLSEFLAAGGVRILREIADGSAEQVYSLVCPWSHEHTGGDASGTRAGQYADGALYFRCEHAHCASRGWAEFREMVRPVAIPLGRGKVYARGKGAVCVD